MQRTNEIGFYFSMTDPQGAKHRYRFTPEQLNRETFEPEMVKGELKNWYLDRVDNPYFKFADIISDESARRLYLAVAK